jgi:hypothetical protein
MRNRGLEVCEVDCKGVFEDCTKGGDAELWDWGRLAVAISVVGVEFASSMSGEFLVRDSEGA